MPTLGISIDSECDDNRHCFAEHFNAVHTADQRVCATTPACDRKVESFSVHAICAPVDSLVTCAGQVCPVLAVPSLDIDTVSHVQPITDSLPAELTTEQRQRAISLLRANAAVFSRHEYDVGRTDLIDCKINTGDHLPIAQPLRRHARVYLDQIDESVDKMLHAGIIEPAASPWCSNIVAVPKADGSIRVTIDYRTLNGITYKDKFPLPRISYCFDAMSGSIFFSTIDLSASFFRSQSRVNRTVIKLRSSHAKVSFASSPCHRVMPTVQVCSVG
jgi:hypothetical protein